MRLSSRIRSGVGEFRAALSRSQEAASWTSPEVVPVPPPAELVLSTPTEDIDRAVPRGLRLAASWSWRVILVAVLVYGLARVAGVDAAAESILKVRAVAESCARRMEGTGFVIGRGKVMTNAHVVAGSDRAVVETGAGNLDATVVLYDPQTDLAVLDVTDEGFAVRELAPGVDFETVQAKTDARLIDARVAA